MKKPITSLPLSQLMTALMILFLHMSHGQEAGQKNSAPDPLLLPPVGSPHLIARRRRLHGSGLHREYFCNLDDVPITKVSIKNETSGVMYEVDDNNVTNNNPKQITYSVKPCACYGLVNNSYCPAVSTYCSISVAYNYQYAYITSFIEDHDATVTCFRNTPLISFARYVFKYCLIMVAALFFVLIFTDTGHQVTRHTMSRCFPNVNRRHVEQRLRMEMEQQHQRFFRWSQRIREEGFILALKLKTKIYHPEARKDFLVEGGQDLGDNAEGDTCSICILELEVGERIADLCCGHCFHADCLSEWIKKKNSCPLCQKEGIAEEIRSYDIETETTHAHTTENADSR